MEEKRLDRQFDFIREIDKEKFITRQTYRSDGESKENDAEHAWHMAVMTLLLSEYSNDKIDVLKTVSMILIHDIVEVYAGDTYCYDEQGKKSQKAREEQSAKKIFGLLPDDQRVKFMTLWQEFEAWESPEAKFAHTMDNVQPTMLNNATKGKSWQENSIRLSQILGRNAKTHEGSETLWKYSFENFISPNVQSGKVIDDTEKNK